MSEQSASLVVFSVSCALVSSSLSGSVIPSLVIETSFLPSNSLSCCTAYSSIGSLMSSTSSFFFLNASRKGEFSSAFFDSPVMK